MSCISHGKWSVPENKYCATVHGGKQTGNFFCFCALHFIGRLDYNLSVESEWKSLMVPQCTSSLFFVIMAFGGYMLYGKSKINGGLQVF